MRIKRLDVCGFKSFPDRTTLLFNQPIVGIVGPNGCGKSNIVDAIRWVMGEQRVKSLRGRSREDVIFSGTETHAPMGVAEVTVTFDNSDKLAPADYLDFTDIAVTRKLYRNGESEYLINNAACRLKDITELFLGTGAGSRAYSIIEQGHISLIVSAKPEDRRLMIEEAAGITKYHTRKREAERKMARTRQNLLRITDVIAELKKQLNSLHRQAKKAERYREYKSRIKTLDLNFTSNEYSELLQNTNTLVDQIAELEDQRQAKELKFSAMEGEVDARNLRLADQEQSLMERQEKLHRLDQRIGLDERNLEVDTVEIERIRTREGEIDSEQSGLDETLNAQNKVVSEFETEQAGVLKLCQDREHTLLEVQEKLRKAVEAFNNKQTHAETQKRAIYDAMSHADRMLHQLDTVAHRFEDNQARMRRNREEFVAVEKRFNELKDAKESFAQKLGGLKKVQLELASRRDEQTKSLASEREIYLDLEDRLSGERDQLMAVRSRLDSLSELEQNFEGFSKGVKTVLTDQAAYFENGELVDALARLIEVDSAYDTAVGAALGERLQWLVVNDQQVGVKGVRMLSDQEAGRAGFIPLKAPSKVNAAEIPTACKPLLDHVHPSNGADEIVEYLLADILLAENLETACSGWRESAGAYTFVTPKGELIDKSGAVLGGSGEMLSQAILKRRREMQDLEEQKSKLVALCEQLSQQRDERISAIREIENNVESTRQEGHQQEIKILEQKKDLHHLEAQLEQSTSRKEALEREHETFIAESDRLTGEREKLELERKEAIENQERMEKELTELQESLADLSQHREDETALATEAQVHMAQVQQRRHHLDSELAMARQRVKDLSGRSGHIDHERSRGRERIEQLESRIENVRIQLEKCVEDRKNLHLEFDKSKNDLAVEQEAIRLHFEEAKQVRSNLNEVTKALNEAQMRWTQITGKTSHLEERITEKYGITLKTEFGEYLTEELPGEKELEEMETLNRKIEKMGEVNLTAISEYDRVSERYQFLLDQEEDLQRSLEMLESAIKKINRTTRKRFKETFEEVNKRFSELFPQLFDGGEAYLEFTDPKDLLTTGVEIVARPPGKKLQSVTLLSGGEKALTAISMIFAIFLYRPTPFCLLDEVDAPLDDLNITRFNNALRKISKISQFIVITHSKKTMEITDSLYGVTMEEAGISKIVRVDLT